MARMQLLLLLVGAFALHQSSSSEVRVDMIAGACYINQLAFALQASRSRSPASSSRLSVCSSGGGTKPSEKAKGPSFLARVGA